MGHNPDRETTDSEGSPHAKMFAEKVVLAFITVVAVALIALHLSSWNASTKVDVTVVGLLVLAVLPWLGSVIKKLELPGGFKFEVQEIQKQISQHDKRISEQQRVSDELLKKQRELIDLVAIKSLHEYIYRHLRIVYDMQQRNSGEYIFRSGDGNMKRDLQELINRDFIEWLDLNALPETTHLVKIMRITEVGKAFVQLREGHFSFALPTSKADV